MLLTAVFSLTTTLVVSGAISPVVAVPTILNIGDSTVTSDAGWGAGFCADTTGLANCTNLAVNGTTTVTWKSRTQYKTMLSDCQIADTWATIQFGHNDQKVMNTTEFATNLESLVTIIQNAGCKPVLVTSLARRNFVSEHVTNDILGPYSNETINVATKLRLPICLLPLLNDSLTYIAKLGKTDSMYFNHDYDWTNTDTTHLNTLGSRYFGRIVADEIAKYIPELSSYIVPNATLSAAIASGIIIPEDLPTTAATDA